MKGVWKTTQVIGIIVSIKNVIATAGPTHRQLELLAEKDSTVKCFRPILIRVIGNIDRPNLNRQRTYFGANEFFFHLLGKITFHAFILVVIDVTVSVKRS